MRVMSNHHRREDGDCDLSCAARLQDFILKLTANGELHQ